MPAPYSPNTPGNRRVGIGAKRDAHRSLTEFARDLADISAPILREHVVGDVPVEGAIRPIAYTRYQAVFDWIEVNIVDVPCQIVFIADSVFPKATLPDSLVAFDDLAWRTRCRLS